MMKKRLLCSAAVASLTLGFALDASAQPNARSIRFAGNALEKVLPAVKTNSSYGTSVALGSQWGASHAIRVAGRAEPGGPLTTMRLAGLDGRTTTKAVRNMGSFDLGTVTLDLPSYAAKPSARGQFGRTLTPIGVSVANAAGTLVGGALNLGAAVLPVAGQVLFGVPAQ